MKICFFLGSLSHPGGIERVTTTLANNLVEFSGIEVDVVCISIKDNKPIMEVSPKVKLNCINDLSRGETKPHSYRRIIHHLLDIKGVGNFFKSHRYDIIVAQAFPLAFMLWASGISMRNVFCCEHTHFNYYGSLIKWIRSKVYKNSGRIVTLTTKDKQLFDKKHDNCICIPNPIIKIIDRKKYDYNSKIILAAGRLCEAKGFDLLLRAYKKIAHKNPEWRVDIWGQGHLKEKLNREINFSNLEGIVFLKGSTDDMRTKYEEASFFVLSSRFEGFSMVLAEALSLGLPVVSYDCPNGPSDFVIDGYNGLLVDNGNIDALAGAIQKMIDSQEMRIKMSEIASKSVDKFAVDKICKRWVEEFHTFLDLKDHT